MQKKISYTPWADGRVLEQGPKNVIHEASQNDVRVENIVDANDNKAVANMKPEFPDGENLSRFKCHFVYRGVGRQWKHRTLGVAG